MIKGVETFGPAERSVGSNIDRATFRVNITLCLCAFVPLCLVFFFSIPAIGHVLPGQQLLLLMTENLGSATSLEIHQHVIVHDDTEADATTQLSETLTYRFSNAFRCESTSPSLTRIHVDTLDDAVTIQDGRVSIQNESRFDRYPDLLLFHSRILLQERLSRRGIDIMESSLGRFEGVPVYILGAQYPDMTTAQIWIDKETFHPLRMLIPMRDAEGNSSILEFRYLLWQRDKKLWYPMRIECYEDENLVREIVVDKMTINPQISDEIFDIKGLRQRYGEESPPGQEMQTTQPQSDIQKTLDDFKKRYE